MFKIMGSTSADVGKNHSLNLCNVYIEKLIGFDKDPISTHFILENFTVSDTRNMLCFTKQVTLKAFSQHSAIKHPYTVWA